jgi:hypothetical protein
MVRNQVGRPPAEGPRYDCGRRKPQADPRGPATWHFLREHGDKLGADERLRTELGRLAFAGELTERQVDAGFLVARIYGEFERYKGKRRSVGSPSYVRAFGDPHAGEDELNPDELERLEHRIHRATKRFLRLQECFEVWPPSLVARARAIIEAMCVEDRHVPDAVLEHAAPMLDYIAQVFELADAGPPKKSIAVTSRRPPRRAAGADPRGMGEKTAWLKCTKALRPDLEPAQLEEAWRTFRALRDMPRAKQDCEKFRSDKARRRRT